MSNRQHFSILAAASILAMFVPKSSLAADPTAEPDFFGAALCEPAYSLGLATQLYEEAEKLGWPGTSILGSAIYALPTPIKRDGLTAGAVVFAGTSIGVLLDGEVSEQAAQRYLLVPENSHLLGASKHGFSRELSDDRQAMKDLGLISVVARESAALDGRTLLACEFVSHEDRTRIARGSHEDRTRIARGSHEDRTRIARGSHEDRMAMQRLEAEKAN